MNYADSKFTQVMDNTLDMINSLISESPTSVKILMFFMKNMRKKDNAIAVSQSVLAERLKCSRSSVAKCTKILSKKNWIEIVKVGNMNVYVVNERVAWCNHNHSRKSALFSATIYADMSEQDALESKQDFLYKIPEPETLKHIFEKQTGIR